MKKSILLLGFVAFAYGLEVKEGSSLKATIVQGSTSNSGPGGGCLAPPRQPGISHNHCQGSARIIIKDDGNVKDQGTLVQKRMAEAVASHLKYPGLPPRREVKKREIIIQTVGNCCWEFFARYLPNKHSLEL